MYSSFVFISLGFIILERAHSYGVTRCSFLVGAATNAGATIASLLSPNPEIVLPLQVPCTYGTDESAPYRAAESLARERVAELVRREPYRRGQLLRLAFHDAIASWEGVGGADGSILLELGYPENRGLEKPLAVLRPIYEELRERFGGFSPTSSSSSSSSTAQRGKNSGSGGSCGGGDGLPLSWADLIAVAGAEAVGAAGGPSQLLLPLARLGRPDALAPTPLELKKPLGPPLAAKSRGTVLHTLPEPGLDADGLVRFYRRLFGPAQLRAAAVKSSLSSLPQPLSPAKSSALPGSSRRRHSRNVEPWPVERLVVALSGAHTLGRHVTLLGLEKKAGKISAAGKPCLQDLDRACLDQGQQVPFVSTRRQVSPTREEQRGGEEKGKGSEVEGGSSVRGLTPADGGKLPFREEEEEADRFDAAYFESLLRWDARELGRGDALFLPTDVILVVSPRFRPWVEAYAADESLFFADFASAYEALVEIGLPSLIPAKRGLLGW